MPLNRKEFAAFAALSDHLTNNKVDYYEIPESKISELARVYNKSRMILLSWDDKHEKFDVNCLNTDVDKKVIERILKISKVNKPKEL
jgi:hypothetical protein